MPVYRKPCTIERFRRNFWPTGYLIINEHIFPKKILSPKMVAILNFRIFRKNCKTQKCLYLENRAI